MKNFFIFLLFSDLTPEVAEVEVGEELIFNCTIFEKYINNGEVDISKVFFVKNETPIDKKYVEIIPQYNLLQLKISNASLADNGEYSCHYNNSDSEESTSICFSNAIVGCKLNLFCWILINIKKIVFK